MGSHFSPASSLHVNHYHGSTKCQGCIQDSGGGGGGGNAIQECIGLQRLGEGGIIGSTAMCMGGGGGGLYSG